MKRLSNRIIWAPLCLEDIQWYLYIHMCRFIVIYWDLSKYVYIYIHMWICTYMYMYMYIFTYIYFFISTYACVHIYIYICIYIYIYLYTYNPAIWGSIGQSHMDSWTFPIRGFPMKTNLQWEYDIAIFITIR